MSTDHYYSFDCLVVGKLTNVSLNCCRKNEDNKSNRSETLDSLIFHCKINTRLKLFQPIYLTCLTPVSSVSRLTATNISINLVST